MKNRLFILITVFCATSAVQAVASRASAQDCVGDEDCPKGYECQVVGEMSCDMACAEGETCTMPDSCESGEVKACVALPCTSDEDCAEGMICHTYTYEECPVSATVDCPEGGDCVEPVEPIDAECQTTSESSCIPKYNAPCEQDDDCGEGFTCKEIENCRCSGSAGRPASGGDTDGGSSAGSEGSVPEADPDAPQDQDAGAADDVASETCECEPSGEFYCEMNEVDCTEDTECAEGWTCDAWEYATVSCVVPEGSDEVCSTEPAVISKICLPPYHDLGLVVPGAVAMGESLGRDTLYTTGTDEDGEEVKGSNSDDEAEAGGSPSGGSTENSAAADEESKGDSGCQVANLGAASGGGLAWLGGLLALIAVRRRRRNPA